MAIQAGVGISAHEDAYVAGLNATQMAMSRVGDNPNFIIVFASSKYDQEKILAGAKSVAGAATIVGSSTAGEITTEGPAARHSVAVMAIKSDSMKFFANVGENIANGAVVAGKTVADAVRVQAGSELLQLFMMFPDILAGNGADVVRGALSSLGEHFPIVGGASGDDFDFKKTYQYLGDKVYSGSVVGVGIAGTFKYGVGVKHGWIPVGAPKRVTKSTGSTINEIDGKPAISIYEDYFGKEEAAVLKTETLAKLGLNYPLGMKSDAGEEMLIRAPLNVNQDGSIVCAAEVPEGKDVQLMIGSREEAVRAAKEAAAYAVAQLEGSAPKAVIIFNCIARNKVFGDRSGEEITAIQEAVGKDTPLIGFYTYGEQAPLGGETRHIEQCNSAFHNETVVICVIAE